MAHHGWVRVKESEFDDNGDLKFPFVRLVQGGGHAYDSHAISLLSGAMGPMQKLASNAGLKEVLPAGFTFLGQFIDHDLTELIGRDEVNAVVPNAKTTEPRQVVTSDTGTTTILNGRTARFDLDSVYGLQGVLDLDLFDRDGLFLMNQGRDIVRGIAGREMGRLIADPRNDENKIIVQVHLLFEKLHNKIHSQKIATTGAGVQHDAGSDIFNESREETQKVFRRIVIHDYLPRITSQSLMKTVFGKLGTNTALYSIAAENVRKKARSHGLSEDEVLQIFPMPVEFAHAAFRFGHTQLQDGYRLNALTQLKLFLTEAGDRDLRGDEEITADLEIDWKYFFELQGVEKSGAPVDAALPDSIFRLPPPTIGEPPLSLAERNIRRGIDVDLPTAQEMFAALKAVYGTEVSFPDLTSAQLFPDDLRKGFREVLGKDRQQGTVSFETHTPLWYYILREAEQQTSAGLGPLGSVLCAETILGCLYLEDPVFLSQEMSKLGTTPTVSGPDDIQTMVAMIEYIEQAPLAYLGS